MNMKLTKVALDLEDFSFQAIGTEDWRELSKFEFKLAGFDSS